jgi:nucleotide-binding universal stress UspA family protein
MKSLASSSRRSLNNILFATDLSPAAEWALPFALELARRYHSKLYAVHVIQLDVSPAADSSQRSKVAQEQEDSKNQARRLLQEQLRDIPHELIFPRGEVWPTLSAVIGEKQADLLVASTNGRSGPKAPAFGSVAQEIFQQAPCPVLTVGPSVPSHKNVPVELKRILYATDFTFESVVAVHLAISLALEYGAQLILFHAMASANSNHETASLQTLRDLVPFGIQLVPKPKCLVEQGDPPSCILKVASAENADMIVLGLRSAKANFSAPSPPLRSNARKIAIAAACPVLTVRD